MAENFLSQDEVDALLKGVTGDIDESTDARSTPPASGPTTWRRQERIVRGRMPTLEIINERFARLLRIGLFNFLHRSAEVSIGPVRGVRSTASSCANGGADQLQPGLVKPLRGTALIVCDPNLVFLVVDNLFGGDGRFHTRVEGRDFTRPSSASSSACSTSSSSRVRQGLGAGLPARVRIHALGDDTQFANIATPNEVVVVDHLHDRDRPDQRRDPLLHALLDARADPRRALPAACRARRWKWTSAGCA